MRPLQLRFVVWLAAVVALAALFVAVIRPKLVIETDITAMLPQTAPDAVVAQALDSFSAAVGRRELFLIGAADFSTARKAATVFATELARHPAFAAVELERKLDTAAAEALFLPYRGGLLSSADRQLLLDGHAQVLGDAALRALYTPSGLFRARPFTEDPLNLYGDFLAGIAQMPGKVSVRDGVLSVNDAKGSAVLVFATLRDSPFAFAAQSSALAALQSAEQAARHAAPSASIQASGILLHAAASGTRARQEISLFGSLSLVGVLALFLFCFRSLRPLALAVLMLGVAALAAVSIVQSVFGQVHLLALVFGSSLIGVAVDYAVHFFADQFRHPQGWTGERALGHVGPAIVVGMCTTALGYLAFLVPPFPGLRQMAAFSMAGIIAAGLTALLAFPVLAGRGGRAMSPGLGAVTRSLGSLRRPSARVLMPLAVMAVLLMAGGIARLHFVDDIRALQSSSPELLQEEKDVHDRIGGGTDTRFMLIEGTNAEQVLQREETLRARLDGLIGNGDLRGYMAVSRVVPSIARQTDNRHLLARQVYADNGVLPRLLGTVGLSPDIAARLKSEFESGADRFLTPDAWLRNPISEPYRSLWLGKTARGTASTMALLGVQNIAALQQAASGLSGVRLIDRVADISTVLAHYRRISMIALVATLVAIALMIALRYGPRAVPLQLFAPVGGCLLTLALLGWLNVPANLFTILALLLVLGLGTDYGVFLREGREARGVSLLSISIAALTTLLSFGMLSASATPFIHSIGLSTLVGVGSTWLLAILASADEPPPDDNVSSRNSSLQGEQN